MTAGHFLVHTAGHFLVHTASHFLVKVWSVEGRIIKVVGLIKMDFGLLILHKIKVLIF